MSEKIYRVRCWGCKAYVGTDGIEYGEDTHYYTMQQVREAARNHKTSCVHFTGDFDVECTFEIVVKA